MLSGDESVWDNESDIECLPFPDDEEARPDLLKTLGKYGIHSLNPALKAGFFHFEFWLLMIIILAPEHIGFIGYPVVFITLKNTRYVTWLQN